MKAFVSYCGVLVITILAVIGLGRLRAPVRSSPKRIHINGCNTPDEPAPHSLESIDFYYPDESYEIEFLPTLTPNNGSVVPVSKNPFTIQPGTSNLVPVQGPSDCSDAGCYYKYVLRKLRNGVPIRKPCRDPGIHIVP